MATNFDSMIENKSPASSPEKVSADVIGDLKLISEVFQKIEKETAEVAELIFDYLIDVSDDQIMMGVIPDHPNPKVTAYIKILNRLFLLSRKNGRIRVVNRKTVEDLDKKTFAICMSFDGGVSLDVLCDVVNEENLARTPTKSPVKVTVKQAFSSELNLGNSR